MIITAIAKCKYDFKKILNVKSQIGIRKYYTRTNRKNTHVKADK